MNPAKPNPMASPVSKRLKTLAVALLALALGCVVLALWASQRQTLVQGPWGLAVLPGGQVWLSVDEELWRLDADGRRQQVVSAAAAGLPGAAGVLMPHPAGDLVAWSRRSPTLHLLAAASARPLALLTPQWPADLARHGEAAISYAFAPDGRVAIAAGGGHAVALFDAQGRYLARSPPDTFHFTNGLWWADGGWWTTDTNRPALVRLDDTRLTEARRIALEDETFGMLSVARRTAQEGPAGGWVFLGLAGASRGAALDGQPPVGVVSRLGNGMQLGHVVDVWPDGQQRAYPIPDGQSVLEPRALAWLGDTLLVLDGQGFAIRRYDAHRQRLADWGDAAVQADLARRYAALQRWRGVYHWGLVGAVLLLLAGLGVSVTEQRLRARAQRAAYAPAMPTAADVFAKPAAPRIGPAAQALPDAPAHRRRALWQALASWLVPGSGQWMQGRFGAGLVFLVFWLVLMGQFVFVAWVAWVPIEEVHPLIIWATGLLALVPGLLAAVDAWRLGAHRPDQVDSDHTSMYQDNAE